MQPCPTARPSFVARQYGYRRSRRQASGHGKYCPGEGLADPRRVGGTCDQLYPEDTYSVDHSHAGYLNDFHYDQATKSHPQNYGYALDQEGLHFATDASTPGTVVASSGLAPTANPTLQTKQKGEVVMSHVDCDTIPFLWQYADRFVLFDNFHQTTIGPSTPNAIDMIAGQTGDTQWVKHPSEADPTGLSLPNENDNAPFPGSASDNAAVKPPYGPDENSASIANADTTGNFAVGAFTPQINLTFATLPLSFMGRQINSIIKNDENPTANLADVHNDIKAIAVTDQSVNWGWYQQGFEPEPFDGTSINELGIASSLRCRYALGSRSANEGYAHARLSGDAGRAPLKRCRRETSWQRSTGPRAHSRERACP